MVEISLGEHSNQNLITEDIIVPFLIEISHLQGRAVRLGGALDEILSRHDYPLSVAKLLGELLTVTALLGATLKSDGIITIQIQGNGHVPLIVADCTTEGKLRGYAQIDPDAMPLLSYGNEDVQAMLGDGVMVVTTDEGQQGNRSQGIIELTGRSITDSFINYFKQSVQIDIAIEMAVEHTEQGWYAGSILVQHIPENSEQKLSKKQLHTYEEWWNRAQIFLASVTAKELISTDVSLHDLLYRLFHEDGVRVFEPKRFIKGCRCSREKILSVLSSMPADTIEEMKIDGVIEVICEFCNRTEHITDGDLLGH